MIEQQHLSVTNRRRDSKTENLVAFSFQYTEQIHVLGLSCLRRTLPGLRNGVLSLTLKRF